MGKPPGKTKVVNAESLQENSPASKVLKGHDFTGCGKTLCFERARL
jgi:hypothetical protein